MRRAPRSRLPSPVLAGLGLLTLAACSDDRPPTEPPLDRDGAPPSLLAVSLSPHQALVVRSAVEVGIRVEAEDPSGVTRVEPRVEPPTGGSRTCVASRVDGTEERGHWTCALRILPGDPPGPWRVTSVLLGDAVGNRAFRAPAPAITLFVDVDDAADLVVRFIQRLPALDWVEGSSDPAREGWPAPGETVTWRAHVMNWSAIPRVVGYAWTLDGAVVDTGTAILGRRAPGTVDLLRPWSFQRQELGFVLDPADRVPEESEENNTLRVHTDALSLGLYVEEGLYSFFRETQAQLGIGATTFDDWAQRQVAALNRLFEEALYPETPSGVRDRIRLDRISVVPDGSLPSSRRPDDSDRSVDLIRGHRAAEVTAFRAALGRPPAANANVVDGNLLRELGRARYLVDVSATRVLHGVPGHAVEVEEGGEPVAGSAYLPGRGSVTVQVGGQAYEGTVLRAPFVDGLMAGDPSRLDRYSAAALNLIAGQRATRGNYAEPENQGVFLDDVPEDSRLRLVDVGGSAPLAGAEVRLYRASAPQNGSPIPPGRVIDGTADLIASADGSGEVALGPRPFADGPLDLATTVALLRVEHEGRVGYAFVDAMAYNLAFWRGQTETAVLDLPVALRSPD